MASISQHQFYSINFINERALASIFRPSLNERENRHALYHRRCGLRPPVHSSIRVRRQGTVRQSNWQRRHFRGGRCTQSAAAATERKAAYETPRFRERKIHYHRQRARSEDLAKDYAPSTRRSGKTKSATPAAQSLKNELNAYAQSSCNLPCAGHDVVKRSTPKCPMAAAIIPGTRRSCLRKWI